MVHAAERKRRKEEIVAELRKRVREVEQLIETTSQLLLQQQVDMATRMKRLLELQIAAIERGYTVTVLGKLQHKILLRCFPESERASMACRKMLSQSMAEMYHNAKNSELFEDVIDVRYGRTPHECILVAYHVASRDLDSRADISPYLLAHEEVRSWRDYVEQYCLSTRIGKLLSAMTGIGLIPAAVGFVYWFLKNQHMMGEPGRIGQIFMMLYRPACVVVAIGLGMSIVRLRWLARRASSPFVAIS